MPDAVHVHGEMLRHYATWLWITNNLVTGASYVVIGSLIARGWSVEARFGALFAAFIFACGVHHLVHALPGLWTWPHPLVMSAQVVTDVTMTTVSAVTAVLVARTYRTWMRGVRRG